MHACALLVVAVAAVALAQEPAQEYLDQHTEQTSASRFINHGRMFQSFAPQWDGNLVAIEVWAGSQAPCAEYRGTLAVRRGTPQDIHTGWDTEDVMRNTVAEQPFATSCDPAAVPCDEQTGDCLGWHRVDLAEPIAVRKGQLLSFSLHGLSAPNTKARYLNMAKVGVAPATLNHGGASSLLTSPKFKTTYEQFTFRTWVDTAAPASVELDENLASDAAPHSTDRDATPATASKDGQSANTIASIVAPLAAVVAVVALIVIAVVARRSMARGKYATGVAENGHQPNKIQVRERSQAWEFDASPITSHRTAGFAVEDDGRDRVAGYEMASLPAPAEDSCSFLSTDTELDGSIASAADSGLGMPSPFAPLRAADENNLSLYGESVQL